MSRLPHRFWHLLNQTASAPPAPWSPTDIAGLELWLDASDSTTITLDGSNNVEEWDDKSGNGRNVLNANVLERPGYELAAVNGLNVVRFDGANDRLIGTFSDLTQPSTVFIVFKVTSVATAFQVIFDSRITLPHDIYLATSSLVLEASVSSITGGTLTANQQTLLTGRFNGASSFIRKDKTQVASGNAGTNVLTGGITLGTNRAGEAPLGGDICEFIYYAAQLTSDEIDDVESYLSAKWGTP